LHVHGTFAPLLRRGGAAVTRMCEATRDLDSACARQAMSELIGLGEGSTPAGDDYLVGHFVGLWSSAGADDTRQRFIADLGKSLREMASRTNRVSRVYLEAAADGEVSERLATARMPDRRRSRPRGGCHRRSRSARGRAQLRRMRRPRPAARQRRLWDLRIGPQV
jgi:hypothetical protein